MFNVPAFYQATPRAALNAKVKRYTALPDIRERLKNIIIHRFDDICSTHSIGRQDSKVRRYIYTRNGSAQFELMFEKNLSVPANLWALESSVSFILDENLAYRRSPSANLYVKHGKNGAKLYERNWPLEKMPQLGTADFVCFNVQSLTQLGRVFEALDSSS